MITRENIESIIKTLKTEGLKVTFSDVAYLVLCDIFAEKTLAKEIIYGDSRMTSAKVLEMLAPQLKPFGIGIASSLTMEMNKESLVRRLAEIEEAKNEGTIDLKDAFKLELDYRTKLQDKFAVEEGEKQKRIIVVPQKHDAVCKYTHRECSAMPSKEAVMKYYNLVDNNNE